jgi:hypothetical protein
MSKVSPKQNTTATTSKNLPDELNNAAASTDLFRISVFCEAGVDGYVLNFRIFERIIGTEHVGFSGGFMVDLQCLPALKKAVDHALKKAEQDELLIDQTGGRDE